ncbi:MAG: preprotein translocase subunit SecG [Proteobacteria bacterium]|jgi:preprotein translocase subunit SecG|nr:preprotein translocase subunit SecG [Pseudomonadota bacterium]
METFAAILHILVALVMIVLVLIQDTKSGSLGGAFGGGGSNSVFGATGAVSLAAQLTRWAAVVFAVTCIWLSILSARSGKSVVDSLTPPVAVPTATETTSPPATQ